MKSIIDTDLTRSELFSELLDLYGLNKYELSVAIIDLSSPEPKIFGYNMDHFIYPASVYKIFIAAEVLRRVELGDFSLDKIIEVKSPNDVDKDSRIFPGDTRKLLCAGDKVTLDVLVDLMLTRSDNTASNCLIDFVGRENITENIIYQNGWHGSEVTRKFLNRKMDEPYQFSATTMSCTRHLSEFFYLVETNKLVSQFVSQSLKNYMLRRNKQTLSYKGLETDGVTNFYGKGGWLENNLWNYDWKYAIKNIFRKGWSVCRWSNDAGVVTGKNSHYAISVLSVSKSITPWSYFPIKELSSLIHSYVENK